MLITRLLFAVIISITVFPFIFVAPSIKFLSGIVAVKDIFFIDYFKTECPKKVWIKTFILTCSLLQFTVFEFIWNQYICKFCLVYHKICSQSNGWVRWSNFTFACRFRVLWSSSQSGAKTHFGPSSGRLAGKMYYNGWKPENVCYIKNTRSNSYMSRLGSMLNITATNYLLMYFF